MWNLLIKSFAINMYSLMFYHGCAALVKILQHTNSTCFHQLRRLNCFSPNFNISVLNSLDSRLWYLAATQDNILRACLVGAKFATFNSSQSMVCHKSVANKILATPVVNCGKIIESMIVCAIKLGKCGKTVVIAINQTVTRLS